MKVYRRYSDSPLLELRLDHGSERTVKDRPYLHFHCGQKLNGEPRKRMKCVPGTPEQADAFIQANLTFFLVASGAPWAREAIHDVLKAHGGRVRQRFSKKEI
jgi:hypothetical protein